MPTLSPASPFIWYDLMTTDTAAAAAFYSDVVGWNVHPSGQADIAYMLLSVEGGDMGGMMAIPDAACSAGTMPSWNGYIYVDDVDGYTARVRKAGGSIHQAPTDIPGIGRFAAVTDPQGAFFYLFKPAGDGSATMPAPNTPGTVGWRELHAADGAQAFAFYTNLFGWEKAGEVPMGPMGVYQLFAPAGQPGDMAHAVGGMMTKMDKEAKPGWLYYFIVDSVFSAAERVKQGRGTVLQEPQEVPGGSWIIRCQDPQGAMFALTSAKR